MNQPNTRSFFYPFFLVLFTLGILAGFSFMNMEYEGNGLSIKNYNLLSELEKEKVAPVTNTLATVDSSKSDSILVALPDSMSILDFGKDTVGGLAHFFDVLLNIQNAHKKIRVGYYGDSMIEGDLLTQELRKLFQQRYGGVGVGIVPITSNTAGFRQSIRHSFSEDWETYSLLDKSDREKPIGITGFGFIPKASSANDSTDIAESNSWIKYTAVAKSHIDKFYRIRLYYGKSSGENFINYNNGYGSKTAKLNGSNSVNELSLNENVPTQSFYGSFNCKTPPPLYAMSFESDSGVFVDNFAFRGNSGMPLTKIPYSVLTGFNNYLHYDLIVLHYGLNATSPKVTDYSWYERGLNNMVAYFKSAFPNTSILVVSVNDKSYKKNGEYITDPSVPLIVDVEKRVAETNKVAFWNLYEAMGGYNSMVQWATADTALANKDYTHPNSRGANKIANMLYNELNKELDEYKKKKAL
jgi:hypothetical protein